MKKAKGRKTKGRKASRKSGGRKFAYRARTYDEAQKRANESSGNFDQYLKDKYDTWKPAEKGNRIRLLEPTWDDAQSIGYQIYLHYSIGPDDQTYICTKETLNKPCAVCDERKRVASSADSEYLSSLSPKKRVLVWMIDRKKEEDGPKIWPMPLTVDKEVNLQATDSMSREVLAIDDPDEGHDIEFTRTGTGLNTKYLGVKIVHAKSPISDDEDTQEEIIQFIFENPLTECLNIYDYDYVNEVFIGEGDSEEEEIVEIEEEEEEEKPKKKKKRGKLKSDKETEKDLGKKVAALAKKKRNKKGKK